MELLEQRCDEMLKAMRQSGFWESAIDEARRLHAIGYVWDVALKISHDYWCR
jgi:hypothetical protein